MNLFKKLFSKNYYYFIDSVKIKTNQKTISGTELRADLPFQKSGYSIWIESNINLDLMIKDSDIFSLANEIPHFYTVPPTHNG